MSGGTYAQNFDSLANTGTANTWVDNVTLPGWYASKSLGGNAVTAYRAGTGSDNSGALYSFGDSGSTDRALGSVASGTPGNFAYGVCLTNDTTVAQTNFTVSYTGEQWRVANASVQKLAFAYQVGTALTNADAANAQTWTAFPALDFSSPTTGATAQALPGNDPTNQTVFANIFLSGVVVQPGQELFLRWFDTDDSGFDDGLAIDNLTISFQATNSSLPRTPPYITTQPQSQIVNVGDPVTFTVVASGTAPLSYQWQSNNIAVPGATNDTFNLADATVDLSGNVYFVTITNVAGSTNSQAATLTVRVLPPTNDTLTVMTYNVKGNGVADWSTNTAQVQAIGRQLIYLRPDVITFNEIPRTNMWQMPNWMTAFLPGYYLATNSIGDGFILSCIASRYPILSSTSHLHGANLDPFGYTNSNFTRDLFEAQIAVSNYPVPLHVFVAHLKATTSSPQSDADKRAAEASAVSNYFVTVYLAGTSRLHPYVLDGDMNEDAFFPETNNYTSGQPLQRLTSPPTGLVLTTPVNPITHASLTESIQSTLDTRFDYILPCQLQYSNVVNSQVFRTDVLSPLPPGVNANDDKTASDHLPVLMVFANPYTQPFHLTSLTRNNSGVTLQWETLPGQNYRVECSSNLVSWATFADNLAATNFNFTLSTNLNSAPQFFRVRRLN